jgi:hypothetical protein
MTAIRDRAMLTPDNSGWEGLRLMTAGTMIDSECRARPV